MANSDIAEVCISKHTRIISNGDQHALFNPNKHTWLKISDSLWEIIQALEGHSFDDAIKDVCRAHLVPEEGLRESVSWLITMGLLEKIDGDQKKRVERQRKDHTTVVLCVTDLCNLRCPYCIASLPHYTPSPGFTLSELKVVARKLQEINPSEVTISGGEPLLRQQPVEVIRILHEAELPLTLSTNGTLLDEDLCARIAPYLSVVVISIDGSTQEVHDRLRGTGTFAKAIRGIENLKEADFRGRILIRPVVCRPNIDDIPNIIGLAKRLGVDFMINRFIPIGRGYQNISELEVTPEEMDILEKKLWIRCAEEDFPEYPDHHFYKRGAQGARLNCGAGTLILHILADGSIYPCTGLTISPKYKIGNILEARSLEVILKSSRLVAELASRSVDNIQKCQECDIRYLCGAGCLVFGITEEECKWSRNFHRRRLWKWTDGASLWDNIEAIFGKSC